MRRFAGASGPVRVFRASDSKSWCPRFESGVSPSLSPRSRMVTRYSDRRGIDRACSPSPVGKARRLRFERRPGIPRRDSGFPDSNREHHTRPCPNACPNRRPALLRERRANRTARSSVALSQPGWAEPSARRSRLKRRSRGVLAGTARARRTRSLRPRKPGASSPPPRPVGGRRLRRAALPTGLVSSRRPSNRACGSPAHGSPTSFTAGIRLSPPGPVGPGRDDGSVEADQARAGRASGRPPSQP